MLGDEAAASEVFDQGLVDRRAGELEVGEVFGEREPGDGELVLDRARLLLADLGREQVADDPLRFVLTFDGGRHDVIEGGLHAVEPQLAHEVEDLGAFHQSVLHALSGRVVPGRPPGQRAIQGWERGRTQNRYPLLLPALAGCRSGRNQEWGRGAA